MAQIFITQHDHDRLLKLLNKKKPHDEFDKALLGELEKGKIVESKDIPADVITMNSQIRFSDENGKSWEYWLVFPEDADIAMGKISVLSPIGCALLGYKVGDTVTINMPNKDKRELTVKEIISQPEREGNFDL